VLRRTADPHAVHCEVVDDVLVALGPKLEAVLAEVGARLGPDAEVLDARREIVGGIAGFFGREQFTVEARLPDAATAPSPAEPSPATGAQDGASFAAELARALREAEQQPLPDWAVAPSVAPSEEEPARPVEHPPVGGTVPPPGSWHVEQGALLALAAHDLPAEEVREHLADLVGTVPDTPARGILAVVGDAADALAVAEGLAAAAGGDPADVLVATPDPTDLRPAWLTVTGADDAARRAARWHGSGRLTVVAVVLQPGLDGLAWARDVLGALRADQVRLAVPGWRRPDELAPRLMGLGCVHAIDVCEPVEWPNAAGFLGLPIPVATIAGRPATVEVWAGCLAGHAEPVTLTAEEVTR